MKNEKINYLYIICLCFFIDKVLIKIRMKKNGVWNPLLVLGC
jgi:hypothetical protein